MTDPVESLAQRVAERVVEIVVDALDVNALVRRVNLNAALGQLDINELLTRVDVNALLNRVDIDALLGRVDVNALLNRADVEEVMRRVDVGAVLDRVDVNELVQRVDIDVLIGETDLGAIIARSSGGAASEGSGRGAQPGGWPRSVHRPLGGSAAPAADIPAPSPGANRPAGGPGRAVITRPPAVGWVSSQGRYAGAASRFTAYVIDLAVSAGLFALGLAGTSLVAQVVTGHPVSWSRTNIIVAVIFVVWEFVYFGYCWAASGRTFGMAVLGVRVVRADRRAA